MPFTISLSELEKAVNEGSRPALVPVRGAGERASATYVAKMVRYEKGVWPSAGSEYIEYVFQIVSPEWVTPNAEPTTKDNESAVYVAGSLVSEKVTLVEKVTSWKLPAMFAGYKNYLVEKGLVEEVDGEARAAIDPLAPDAILGVPVAITVQRRLGQEKSFWNEETKQEEVRRYENREVVRTAAVS